MRFPKISMAVAVAAMAAYGLFVWWMVHQAGSPNWNELTYVYGSISGIVVLAAGVVLGSASQQQSVNNARQDAGQAKGESASLKADAAVGRSMEDVVKTLKQSTDAGTTPAVSHARMLIGSSDQGQNRTSGQTVDSLVDFLLDLASATRARHTVTSVEGGVKDA